MSRSSEKTVLIPGREGWQIWKSSSADGLSLVRETSEVYASAIGKLPSSDVQMTFPVRQVTALPMLTPSQDEELFEDLAGVHAEQMGFRPEMGAGILSDTFVISSEESSILLPVVLAAPEPGSMPLRSPKEFDISARLYPLPEGAVALWEEFGRWVFAVGRAGELLYFQGLSEPGLGAAAAREISLALAQLQLQGCQPDLEKVVVWHEASLEGYVVPEEFTQNIELTVEVEEKPTPRLPASPSRLLPEDVVAARHLRTQKRNVTIAIAASIIALLSVSGYFGWQFFQLKEELKEKQAEIAELKPRADAITLHKEKWQVLADLVKQDQWPVELLSRVTLALPRNRNGFRLSEADISGGVISIKGEATLVPSINEFKGKLRNGSKLKNYEWSFPQANPKRDIWSFVFEGYPAGTRGLQGS